MRISVLINRRAGSLVGADEKAIAGTVHAAFEAAGHEVGVEVLAPDALEAALASIAAEPVDAVVVGGGDGTANTAARAVMGTGKALGILPLGTLNRLARDLGMPLALEEAANALAEGEVRHIDVAEVNGRLFLCNVIMGLPLHYTRERARLRGKPALERLLGYLGAVRRLLESQRRMRLIVTTPGETRRLKALSVAVSSNPYAQEPSMILRRESLDAGELVAYISRHSSGWAMAAATLRALLGRIEGEPNVMQIRAPEMTIASQRPRLTVSIDGEMHRLATPLELTLRARALPVLAPRRSPDAR
ncbi:MAG: diacylglycerol kinase family protein [Hyphomicrobiaceae bacterium]